MLHKIWLASIIFNNNGAQNRHESVRSVWRQGARLQLQRGHLRELQGLLQTQRSRQKGLQVPLQRTVRDHDGHAQVLPEMQTREVLYYRHAEGLYHVRRGQGNTFKKDFKNLHYERNDQKQNFLARSWCSVRMFFFLLFFCVFCYLRTPCVP